MEDLIARDMQFTKLRASLDVALGGHLQIVFVTGEAGIGKTVLINTFVKKAKQDVQDLLVAGEKCYAVAGSQQEPYMPFTQILEALLTSKMDQSTRDLLYLSIANAAPEWVRMFPEGDFTVPNARMRQMSSVKLGVSVHFHDIYDRYETGLNQLLNRMDRNHTLYTNALIWQQRLLENIDSARRYGDTERRRSDRSEIIDQLNKFTLVVLNMTFDELYQESSEKLLFTTHAEGADLNHRMVQYTNALRLIAEVAPLLLWIDDLQWSDNATLDLISFIADHAHDRPIMLVAAYRPTDIVQQVQNQPHPLMHLEHKLKRYQQCHQIAVPLFSRGDLDRFVDVYKYSFPTAFVDRLWRQSGGNPLFIHEYITLMHALKLLKKEHETFVLIHDDVLVEIPDTVHSVIDQRMGLIERDLRRTLSYASVQGERFTSRVLAKLLETPEMNVLEKLNLLDRVHQLIRELEEQRLLIKIGTEYQFVHVLIQQVLYNDLNTGQRCLLHLAIAQMMEVLYGNEVVNYAADLATHFEQGRDVVQATKYYLLASRNALQILALDDGLRYAEKVRQLAQHITDKEQAQLWQMNALIDIAQAYFWKAGYPLVLAVCEEGEKVCEQAQFTVQHAHLLYWRFKALEYQGHRDEAVKAIRKALEILGTSENDIRLQGYLYVNLGGLDLGLSIAETQQAIDTALEIAEKHNLKDIKASALRQKTWIAMNRLDKPIEALGYIREALDLTQALHLIYYQAVCHRLISYISSRLGHKDDAVYHIQEALIIARRCGLPRLLHMTLYSQSLLLRQMCEDSQGSIEAVRESVHVAEKYFQPNRYVLRAWFHMALNLGLWQEAEQALKRYHECIESSNAQNLGFHSTMVGRLAYTQGRFEEAIEAYQRALTMLQEHMPDERDYRQYQIYLGLSFIEVGDLRQSIEQLEQANHYWQNRNKIELARSLHGLGRADLRQGNFQKSSDHLKQALVLSDGYVDDEWPTWPYAYIDLAQAQQMLGQTAEALESAIFVYTKFAKWGDFLLGEAAFIIGQLFIAEGRRDKAIVYLREARNEWKRLGLDYRLVALEVFVQQNNMINEILTEGSSLGEKR